ncbi:MAG: hypothetical protein ACLSX0_01755 [Anaerostipes caccae]|jgi:hypothetical protein
MFLKLLDSFVAFHVNGMNNLIYIMTTNVWFLLSGVGVTAIMLMSLKKEIDDTTREKQNII